MRPAAVIAVVAALGLVPTGAEGRAGTGKATFRHGGRTYRLPLESIELEEIRAPAGTEVHVSLVFRDPRNRVIALSFVHRGQPRVVATGSIDLTVSTPSGLSRYDARRSRCELDVTAARPAVVEGKGRCRELFDFSGERAPDVADLRFTAREAPGPSPPAGGAGVRSTDPLSGSAAVRRGSSGDVRPAHP